jgi:hypothetical protein
MDLYDKYLEQVFYKKYLKYKTKYQKLKSQRAESELDGLTQSIELDNLHVVYKHASQYLQTVIPQDKFLTLD